MVGEAEVTRPTSRRVERRGACVPQPLLVGARRNDRRGINTTVGRRDVFGDQTFAVAAHALEYWIRDLCANQPVNDIYVRAFLARRRRRPAEAVGGANAEGEGESEARHFLACARVTCVPRTRFPVENHSKFKVLRASRLRGARLVPPPRRFVRLSDLWTLAPRRNQQHAQKASFPKPARSKTRLTHHRRYTRSGALPQDASTRTSPTFVKGGRPSRCAEKSTTVASESKDASRTSA